MDPRQFYQNKLEELRARLKQLQQRKSSFAWLRLGAIFAIIAGFYFLWSLGIVYVIIASVVLLIIFVRLVNADLKNQGRIEHTNQLIRINENELKFLDGNYYNFPSVVMIIVHNL